MDSRRRAAPTRPASTEVNRLISAWPTDDTVPAEGLGGLKATQAKLTSGLTEITSAAEQELKAIDDAIERVSVLIALRKAPETLPSVEKRKRPKATSPSGTPIPNASALGNTRSVSITLPPRTSSVGPNPNPRDSRMKKDLVTKQQALQPGRKVAFRPPKSTETEEGTWIVAVINRLLSSDKQGVKYEVQDAEPQEDGQPGAIYTAGLKSILPLPDPEAPSGSPAHLSLHPTFPVGSVVLALYPDTSCFYRAEVISVPIPDRSSPSAKYTPTYHVKFEDDDDMIHTVPAHHVVQFPSHHL
ncbi:SGF29 tudor-like domain-containing protein [Gymnopilus junonius]|uniref:SGF29 tudor-like domain-containing protein n=1 Tax=Gymnopilus junonius TaxID=109634 RepID=A0A9P5TRL9_GYMJU|nr:SGF29 tudor-like domain-containing protein [Gymnopilus junonius]